MANPASTTVPAQPAVDRPFDVLGLGEPLLEFSELLADGPSHYLPGFGGDTSNAVIAAARQGARVAYATRLGHDVFGDRFVALWRDEGVDTSLVARDADAFTGIYFVTHGEGGHEFSYYRRGSAASLMRPGDLPTEAIDATRLLHVSGISQAISAGACDAVFAAIAAARERGVLISYDTNLRLKLWPLARARAVILESISQCDLCLPSLEDATAVTGLRDPDAIVDAFLARGAQVVALKLGAAGALVASADERHRVPGLRVATVDATGAGDTFDGAFLAEYLRGAPLAAAARYANAAAALSTQGYGRRGADPAARGGRGLPRPVSVHAAAPARPAPSARADRLSR
jgi:2-dehydro-3-deoxygluconokinase